MCNRATDVGGEGRAKAPAEVSCSDALLVRINLALLDFWLLIGLCLVWSWRSLFLASVLFGVLLRFLAWVVLAVILLDDDGYWIELLSFS